MAYALYAIKLSCPTKKQMSITSSLKKLGGTDKHKNLLVLHKTCHTQVTHVKDPEVIARFVTKGILDLKIFSE